MFDWSHVFYISMDVVALLLSALGLWLVAIIPGIDRWSKRFFFDFFFVFLLCAVSAFVEIAILTFNVSHKVYYFFLVMQTTLLFLPVLMLAMYLVHCCGDDLRSSKFFYAVLGLAGVFLAVTLSSLFVTRFVYVTSDNQFYRGPLYPLLLVPVIATLLLDLVVVVQRRKQLSRKTFLAFLMAILPMTVAFFVQMFYDVFLFVDISYVLSALSMYSFVLSDQIERNLRYEREIANQRANIMVLQMRPHFIYNTMTSIYCLCDQDPKLARQVVMDFTTYLRKNFTAIESSEPIPFSSELEHIRAYLAVEQALYEDGLVVEYDTPHTMFRVPPLTVQPIVENAVKHGRDPYAGPFHISIRTKKTESGSEIVVADNGRGFDTTDDSEPHIALKNIRQRLAMMCKGKLTILSDGDGTVVTVMIPDPSGQ